MIAATTPAICEIRKLGAFCEVATLVFASLAKQHFDAVDTEPVELIDSAHCGEAFFRRNLEGIHRAVENFAVVHFHHITTARNTERFHCVRCEHAHLGIGRHRSSPDRIRVKLHELAEAPGPRLLVAEHPTITVGAVRQREVLEIFRDVTRKRGGQVVTQRKPLLVIILKRKDAFVWPILVGQELAEGVGIFDRRCLHWLKAIALEYDADRLDHVASGRDLGRPAVGKAARQAGFEFGWLGHRRVAKIDNGRVVAAVSRFVIIGESG